MAALAKAMQQRGRQEGAKQAQRQQVLRVGKKLEAVKAASLGGEGAAADTAPATKLALALPSGAPVGANRAPARGGTSCETAPCAQCRFSSVLRPQSCPSCTARSIDFLSAEEHATPGKSPGLPAQDGPFEDGVEGAACTPLQLRRRRRAGPSRGMRGGCGARPPERGAAGTLTRRRRRCRRSCSTCPASCRARSARSAARRRGAAAAGRGPGGLRRRCDFECTLLTMRYLWRMRWIMDVG